MAFSKVILNNTTLMDVTQTTVTEDTLGEGMTSLNSAGLEIIGVADIVRVVGSVPSVKDTNIIKVSGTNDYYAWKVDGVPPSGGEGSVIIPIDQKYLTISLDGGNTVLVSPYQEDFIPGYVDSGNAQWIPQNSTNNRSDFYYLEQNTLYWLGLGGTVGSRFRAILINSNPYTATSNVSGYRCINVNDPTAYQSVVFVNTDYSYLAVTKDNASVDGLKSYLVKINLTMDLE